MRSKASTPALSSVQVADHTTLVVVTKQAYVTDQLIQESVLSESYEKIHVTPMYVDKNFFAKSIVVDAREVNPEVVDFPKDDNREIDVRKIEVEIILRSDDPITVSYSFSGYDRGCDVVHKSGALKYMSKSPNMYLEPVEGLVQFRVITSIADVRSFYTYDSCIHKKFEKYNPREYCYFTVFAVSEGVIKEAAMNLCRIFQYMDEPAGRIYKGPVIRNHRVTCSNKKPKYKYKVNIVRERLQTPSPMTESRRKLLDVTYRDKGLLLVESPLSYELKKIHSFMSIKETYDDNGTVRQVIHQSIEYQLKERDKILSSGLLYYDDCVVTESDEDRRDKIIDTYYQVRFSASDYDRIIQLVMDKYVFEIRSEREVWIYSDEYPAIADAEIILKNK